MAWYKTGTVSVTNGSTAVTGSGTQWIANAGIGEAIKLPDGKYYEISAISSDTSITLATNYLGTTQSGQAYEIVPTQSYIRDLAAQAATLVNSYADTQANAGAGKFGDGTVSAPGVRFSSDTDTGLRRSADGTVTIVSNGVDKLSIGPTGLGAHVLAGNVTSTGNPSLNIGSGALTAGAITASGNITQSSAIARTTYTLATSNGGLQNDNGSAYALLFGSTHATEAKNIWINSDGGSVKIKSTGADVGTFSSTGLAVTGSGTFSNGVTSTADGTQFARTGASTSAQTIQIANTSGQIRLGVENSAGGAQVTGSTGYDSFITDVNGVGLSIGVGQTLRGRFSSTGLAVTGSVSANGLIADGSSGVSFAANRWMTQNESGTLRTYYCGASAGAYTSWEVYRATSTGSPSLAMTLDASGNLLVGSGISGARLCIRDSGSNDSYFGLGANNDVYISSGASGVHYFRKGGTAAMTIDASGNLLVGTASGSVHVLNKAVAEGSQIALIHSSTAGIATASFNAVAGTGFNAALTGIYCGKHSSTNRTINAAGTINASGADYAEYEYNNGLTITKGAIVGFKSDGTLTLTFSEAVRFGIKSTNPSYVGGDTWGGEDIVGKRPEKAEDQTDEEFAPILAAWEATLEAERQKVDRVAYSGKVPVNVTGATAGGYIIASQDADGSITGYATNDPDFAEYKRAVGRVNRILEDGRAEVAVMVH